MARNGPPDDFHNQQTQYANYGAGERPPADGPPPDQAHQPEQPPEFLDPFDGETEPTAWYRKPVAFTAWLVAVLILIALIVFGIIELIRGNQGTSGTPSTSTTTPTTTASTTPPATTTTPSSTTPPTSSAVAPPAQQPTQQQPTRQPTQQQPTHRHHLPPLPSVITIPEVPTVITLPPGLY